VSGFLVDDTSWTIHKLVVETGHWYSGQEILISTNLVERISCEDSKVFVNITIAELQRSMNGNLAKAAVWDQAAEISAFTTNGIPATARNASIMGFDLPIRGGLIAPA
jgi:hypothetical protein